jgi:hypothetical protein
MVDSVLQSPVQLTPWRKGRFNPCWGRNTPGQGEKNSQIFPSYYSYVVSCSRVGDSLLTQLILSATRISHHLPLPTPHQGGGGGGRLRRRRRWRRPVDPSVEVLRPIAGFHLLHLLLPPTLGPLRSLRGRIGRRRFLLGEETRRGGVQRTTPCVALASWDIAVLLQLSSRTLLPSRQR